MKQDEVNSVFRGLTKMHCHPQRGHYLFYYTEQTTKNNTTQNLVDFIYTSNNNYNNMNSTQNSVQIKFANPDYLQT